jgi:hypothetical protein
MLTPLFLRSYAAICHAAKGRGKNKPRQAAASASSAASKPAAFSTERTGKRGVVNQSIRI